MLSKLLIIVAAFLLFIKQSQCLSCFVCHSSQHPGCEDPFSLNGNSSGTVLLFECDRVKRVGEGLIATSNAMGGSASSYIPLDNAPHVCYKMTKGGSAVRGCSKPDFCSNITDVCEVCGSDACNGTPTRCSAFLPFFVLFELLIIVVLEMEQILTSIH